MAEVRHWAAKNSKLTLLSMGKDLCEPTAVATIAGCEDALLVGAECTRGKINGTCERIAKTGDEGGKRLLRSLAGKEKDLCNEDKGAPVDIGFLRASMGDGGNVRMVASVINSFQI